ncbi:MAG: hypothetical protein ACLR7H_07620 [Hominilimicola sp.]
MSTKTTVNNYFMEAKKKNDKLKNDITELNQKSSELDSQIEELQNQNSSLQTTEKTGKTYTLKKDQAILARQKFLPDDTSPQVRELL